MKSEIILTLLALTTLATAEDSAHAFPARANQVDASTTTPTAGSRSHSATRLLKRGAEEGHLMVTLKDNIGYIAINLPNTTAKTFCKDTSGTDAKELVLKLDTSSVTVPVPAASAAYFCKKWKENKDQEAGKEDSHAATGKGTAKGSKSKAPEGAAVDTTATPAKASGSKPPKTPISTPKDDPDKSNEAAATPAPTLPHSKTPSKSKAHASPSDTVKTELPAGNGPAAEADASPTPAAEKAQKKGKASKEAATPTDTAPDADATMSAPLEAETSEAPPLKHKQKVTGAAAPPTTKATHAPKAEAEDDSEVAVQEISQHKDTDEDKVDVQVVGHQKAHATAKPKHVATPASFPEADADVHVPEKPFDETSTTTAPKAKGTGHQKAEVKAETVEKRDIPASTRMLTFAWTSRSGAATSFRPSENAAAPRARSWFWRKTNRVGTRKIARRPHEETDLEVVKQAVKEAMKESTEKQDTDTSASAEEVDESTTADNAHNNLLKEPTVKSEDKTSNVPDEETELGTVKGFKLKKPDTDSKGDSDSDSDDEPPAPPKTPPKVPETQKPAEKPVDKPADKPTDKPTDKPETPKSADKPETSKPAEKPADSKPDAPKPEPPKPIPSQPSASATPSKSPADNNDKPDEVDAPKVPTASKSHTKHPEGIAPPAIPPPPPPAQVATPTESSAAADETPVANDAPAAEKTPLSSHPSPRPTAAASPAPELPSTVTFRLLHPPSTIPTGKHRPSPTPTPTPSLVTLSDCYVTTYLSTPTHGPEKTSVPILVTKTMPCMIDSTAIKTDDGVPHEPDKGSAAWSKVPDPKLRWTVWLLWSLVAFYVVTGIWEFGKGAFGWHDLDFVPVLGCYERWAIEAQKIPLPGREGDESKEK